MCQAPRFGQAAAHCRDATTELAGQRRTAESTGGSHRALVVDCKRTAASPSQYALNRFKIEEVGSFAGAMATSEGRHLIAAGRGGGGQ